MDLPMLLNHSFCILERIYSCILKDIGQVNTPLFLSWSEFSSLFDHSYQHAKCYWSFYIKKKKSLLTLLYPRTITLSPFLYSSFKRIPWKNCLDALPPISPLVAFFLIHSWSYTNHTSSHSHKLSAKIILIKDISFSKLLNPKV